MAITGGQAKNLPLMQLIANVCSVPVVLPYSSSASVVTGAAMLGRFASEVTKKHRQAPTPNEENFFTSQDQVVKVSLEEKESLWDIMAHMTQPGVRIEPSVEQGSREKRLLQAKYKIFRETIEIQRRWRREIEVAAA